MVVCPVCEHAQAGGSECEVCGRRLDASLDAALTIQPLDGLEPTFLPSVPAVDAEPIPGLEQTRLEPVAAPITPDIPELEPTRAMPVDPPVAPLPDVDRAGDDVPAEERTPYPAVVACRYCRTEASPGERICSRCGMRLPTADLPAAPPEAEEALRLCSCGTPIRGSRCASCGARVA
jgi:hypothetical protein